MKKPKPEPKPEVLGLIPEVGQRFNPRKFFRDVIILPASLARYSGLSHGAKLMWGALNSYSALAEIYPATETLGQQIGVGLRMAQRYLDELEAEGFIFVERTNLHFSKTKGGGGTPTYWFLWHPIFNTTSPDTSVSPDVSVSPDGFSKPPLPDMSPPTPDTSVTQTGLIREQVQKEQQAPLSVLGASVCKENGVQADYGFASANNAEGSPDGSLPLAENQNQNPPDVGAVRKVAAERPNPPMNGKPKNAWTGLDVSNMQKWLSAFMDGDQPPLELVNWIVFDLSAKYNLNASDIHGALDAAWKRKARPGEKNAPRDWNWFFETLRNAVIPGYAARLPEIPAAPHPAHHASAEEMARGMEALDGSVVKSYRCKCGAEIRQYTDRVEGVCTCGQRSRLDGREPRRCRVPGKRRAAGGRQ